MVQQVHRIALQRGVQLVQCTAKLPAHEESLTKAAMQRKFAGECPAHNQIHGIMPSLSPEARQPEREAAAKIAVHHGIQASLAPVLLTIEATTASVEDGARFFGGGDLIILDGGGIQHFLSLALRGGNAANAAIVAVPNLRFPTALDKAFAALLATAAFSPYAPAVTIYPAVLSGLEFCPAGTAPAAAAASRALVIYAPCIPGATIEGQPVLDLQRLAKETLPPLPTEFYTADACLQPELAEANAKLPSTQPRKLAMAYAMVTEAEHRPEAEHRCNCLLPAATAKPRQTSTHTPLPLQQTLGASPATSSARRTRRSYCTTSPCPRA